MGGLGCDNMTVILICFIHEGETYEALAEKCKKPICEEANKVS
jgi:protein phosphatase 2C family protein 2/3